MTLQDLIDYTKEENLDPNDVLICDASTLEQMCEYQMITAKIGDETTPLLFLDSIELQLTEGEILTTIANIASHGDSTSTT